jgi:hypothetical protein
VSAVGVVGSIVGAIAVISIVGSVWALLAHDSVTVRRRRPPP